MKNKKSAFTLMELIVTIVILTILSVVVFLSYKNYMKQTRDSVRFSDLKIIENSLEVYRIKYGKYPEPSNFNTVSYNWVVLWKQWEFWESTFRNVNYLSQIPIDPLFENPYYYSVSGDNSIYQLGGIVESSG